MTKQTKPIAQLAVLERDLREIISQLKLELSIETSRFELGGEDEHDTIIIDEWLGIQAWEKGGFYLFRNVHLNEWDIVDDVITLNETNDYVAIWTILRTWMEFQVGRIHDGIHQNDPRPLEEQIDGTMA